VHVDQENEKTSFRTTLATTLGNSAIRRATATANKLRKRKTDRSFWKGKLALMIRLEIQGDVSHDRGIEFHPTFLDARSTVSESTQHACGCL